MKKNILYNAETMEVLNTFEWYGQAFLYADKNPDLPLKVINVTNLSSIPIMKQLGVWDYYDREFKKIRISSLERKKIYYLKKLSEIQNELWKCQNS